MAESFFHTLQLELPDEHRWTSCGQLAAASSEWVECWYNPSRRHSSIHMLSPVDYESAHEADSENDQERKHPAKPSSQSP